MKPPKLILVACLTLAAGAAAATDARFEERSAAHPALYSFVDVFRLTVSGPTLGLPAESAPQAPIRVAAPLTPGAAEPRFSISAVRQPDKWLLLLAGLALAGWVAHRRLVHSL